MLIFLFFFLVADLFSFFTLSLIDTNAAIFIKNLSLFLIVLVSLTSFLNNKLSKIEILYFIFFSILFVISFILNVAQNLILIQSAYLIIYPLLIVNLGKKNSSDLAIRNFEIFIQYFCILNLLFMLFEINNTDLLISLGLSEFWYYVKGVAEGININTGLPFNWHTDFYADTRRGAGLLLAPLASGMLHALGCYISFIKLFENKSRWNIIFLILIFYGLVLTDSRGPMIFLVLASVIYYLKNKKFLKINISSKIFWSITSLISFYIILPTIISAITLQDDRSPAHWYSLINNIINLPQVPILGYGIGTQGAVAAESIYQTLGQGFGTEGALFSTIYQCGLIFGLVFLFWYYSLISKKKIFTYNKSYPILISGIIIMLTSEHFFTISGYIYIWYYIGLNAENKSSSSL